MNVFRLLTSLCCHCFELAFYFFFVTGLWYLAGRISLAPVSYSKTPWQSYKRDFKLLLHFSWVWLGVKAISQSPRPHEWTLPLMQQHVLWQEHQPSKGKWHCVRGGPSKRCCVLISWLLHTSLDLKFLLLWNFSFVLSINPVLPSAKAFPCYLLILPHQTE